MPDHDPDREAARRDLCRFLAACYYQPGPEFAEERLFDSILDAASRIRPDLGVRARRLGAAFLAEGPDNLLVEYTRLFLGPVSPVAIPCGSVWLDAGKSLMGDSAMAVLEAYEAGGFDLDDAFQGPPDHIAAELEFLYLLICREIEALRSDAPDSLNRTTRLRQRFVKELLGPWIGPFTAAIAAGAQSDFYRELAELTRQFVEMEAVKAMAH